MMKHSILGIAVLLLLEGAGGLAQVPTTEPVPRSKPQVAAARPTPVQAAHPIESADIQAFFDGIFSVQLERSDIAGAAVLVMKDGQTLLQKGYGYADWEKKTPVDAASTAFRLASISKLFTWVSVMQLVEQKKLDLDTDVNSYLDFQIRPAFGKPVTLRNLMTHTGGFEEVVRSTLFVDKKQRQSLRDFLIENQPNRLFPPGVIPAYSNYGVGLAGYIVERASGQPFEQYVREHIFTPLGMTHSAFEEPVPNEINASQGYVRTDKPATGFELFQPPPAGGISSSAADMGRFALALLNGGALEGRRILNPETVAAMWTPQFRASEQLPAACMGFYQTWRNGLRFVGHDGDLLAFHSMFLIEPQQKLVLFVSYNSRGSAEKVRSEILRLFADRYYPSSEKTSYLTLSRQEAREYEGSYFPTRRADSTKIALAFLIIQGNVAVDKDGNLTVNVVKDTRGHTAKFRPIAKDVWQQVDDQLRIAFIRDARGKIIRLAPSFPGIQAQRTRWWQNQRVMMPAVAAAFLILLVLVFATLFRFFRRLIFRHRPRLEPPTGTIRVTLGPRLAAWSWLLVLGIIAGIAADFVSESTFGPTRTFDKYFVIENIVACIAVFFSIWAVIAGIRVWFRDVRPITKVKFSLVALACGVLSWVAIHWNLIGSAHRY